VNAVVPSKGEVIIPLGIGSVLPPMTFLGIYSRSGLAFKHGVVVMNGVGIIDRDYEGMISVKLYNHQDTDYEIKVGDRIAQAILQPCYMESPNIEVNEDSIKKMQEAIKNGAKTKREGGFGSTGK